MMIRRKLLVVLLGLFALNVAIQAKVKNYVEVVYFHGKQRCPTCMAIEKYAREVLENDFAGEKKKGKVVFKIVDFSTKEGEKVARDYRVTWSSLYINQWKNGKETRNDLTKFAFKNARKNTDEFKKGVRGKVQELLK